MDLPELPGVSWNWYAAPVAGGDGVGAGAEDLVIPASVMKVQVALTVATAVAEGHLDGTTRVQIPVERRTPGPVGLSLMADEAELSVRDLLVLMMTISDNVATDTLIGLVGVDTVNALTRELGLTHTLLVDDLGDMLDAMAREVGYVDYWDFDRHAEPGVRARLAGTAVFDVDRGTRTTPADMVRLLQLVWTDQAGPPEACATVRRLMRNQLTRHRIASGFPPSIVVAAKSGGLMGLARNEIGVVTRPEGDSYAVAVFTRTEPAADIDPRRVDAAIGTVAAQAVETLSRADR